MRCRLSSKSSGLELCPCISQLPPDSDTIIDKHVHPYSVNWLSITKTHLGSQHGQRTPRQRPLHRHRPTPRPSRRRPLRHDFTGIPHHLRSSSRNHRLGRPLKLFYIGCPSATALQISNASNVVQVAFTAGVCLTHNIDDKEVGPGNLDIMVITGPEPTTIPDEKTQAFVRAHNENKTTFLVICSDAFVTARSGIYEERHVTGPRAFLPMLKIEFPNATWDDSVRVVQDGHIWTGGMISFPSSRNDVVWVWSVVGGITNGIDLVAAYLKATFSTLLVEIVCSMAEVGDRPLKYAASVN